MVWSCVVLINLITSGKAIARSCRSFYVKALITKDSVTLSEEAQFIGVNSDGRVSQ